MLLSCVSIMGLALANSASPVPLKYWVYLKDKAVAPGPELDRALAELEVAADPHQLERRRLRRERPGLFDATDLAVARTYIATVESTGAKVHVESRWLNAISVRATPEQLRAIRKLECVQKVAPVAWGRRSETVAAPMHTPPTDDLYGNASPQINQINLASLHARGFTGTGVRIGVLDTGFARTHAAFNQPGHVLSVVAEHDFVSGDGDTAPQPGDHPDQHVHGTLILGTLGAYKPGELVGGAFGASFILCKTEDVASETPVEEDNYVAGLEFIESHGGDVATASLVYSDWYSYAQFNGQTAPTTIAVNLATANGVHCCNAVGNSGHDADPQIGHISGVPADAFKVLSIGAVKDDGSTSDFSSDGPTADGRLKPELLARGSATATISPSDDVNYATASGTSLSTPLAAAAVACLTQARPAWSVDTMRSQLTSTAGDFVQSGQPDPLIVRGYGIINADAAFLTSCYPNCDGSTSTPALTANDFQCFINAYAAGQARANCDGSTGIPALTANDFQCFINQFAAGCT